MNLTSYEKETVILFNEEETTARVESFNGRLLREIEKAAKNCAEIVCEQREDNYGVYILPKKLIKIHAPRILSEEERAERSERVKKWNVERMKAVKNEF